MNNKYKYMMFVIVFSLLWAVFSFLSSKYGGWAELSEKYPSIKQDTNVTYFDMSISIFNAEELLFTSENTIKIGTSKNGIFMRPKFLFSIGKKAVFIPKSEIEWCETKKGTGSGDKVVVALAKTDLLLNIDSSVSTHICNI